MQYTKTGTFLISAYSIVESDRTHSGLLRNIFKSFGNKKLTRLHSDHMCLGYYTLWVITRSKLVTLFYHLLRPLGYYTHIVVIYDFIKLKYSIFKILFRIIFEYLLCSLSYYAHPSQGGFI